MSQKKSLIGIHYLFVLVLITIILGPRSAAWAEGSSYQFRKTNAAMFVWGAATINGLPIAKGDTIVAIVEDMAINGGCVGVFEVDQPGSYGAMAIYGDDSTTPEKDGARVNDKIILKHIAGKSQAVHTFSASVIWKGNGLVERVDCH